MSKEPRGLGRGLSALLGEGADISVTGTQTLPGSSRNAIITKAHTMRPTVSLLGRFNSIRLLIIYSQVYHITFPPAIQPQNTAGPPLLRQTSQTGRCKSVMFFCPISENITLLGDVLRRIICYYIV